MLALLLLLLLAAGAAHSQSGGSGLTALPGASALDCLANSADTAGPVYPETERLMRTGAVVRVRLSFDKPDAPPEATVFYNSTTIRAFEESVIAHVKRYRLPCMQAGSVAATGTQEFQFVDDSRKVIYGGVRDTAAARARVTCLVKRGDAPVYPQLAFGAEPDRGTVFVSMVFRSPSEPPEVKVLFDGGKGRLARSVRLYVENYRLPCLTPADLPFKTQQSFSFQVGGESVYRLNDLTLAQLIGVVDQWETQKVRFDFATMGCPFDVRLTINQPYASNGVGEIERADPNRREFIEWLSGIKLKLPPEYARDVVAQSLTVSVPCGLLDHT